MILDRQKSIVTQRTEDLAMTHAGISDAPWAYDIH